MVSLARCTTSGITTILPSHLAHLFQLLLSCSCCPTAGRSVERRYKNVWGEGWLESRRQKVVGVQAPLQKYAGGENPHQIQLPTATRDHETPHGEILLERRVRMTGNR